MCRQKQIYIKMLYKYQQSQRLQAASQLSGLLINMWCISMWLLVCMYDEANTWINFFSEYSYSTSSRASYIGPILHFIVLLVHQSQPKKVNLCFTCIIIHYSKWYLITSFPYLYENKIVIQLLTVLMLHKAVGVCLA